MSQVSGSEFAECKYCKAALHEEQQRTKRLGTGEKTLPSDESLYTAVASTEELDMKPLQRAMILIGIATRVVAEGFHLEDVVRVDSGL